MKFSFFALLSFFTIAHSVTAQNFQPFRNKFKYQFTYTGTFENETKSDLIHGMQVDSAKLIGVDSVFYFNKLNKISNNFFKDNFWGNAMVEKAGGEYLFLITNGSQNDTVIVKTQLALGSQWTFRLDNVLYTVTYDHFLPETVLKNQTDPVQTYIVENTIGFKDSIKISENFGLIYSFPFSDDFDYEHNHFNLTYIFNSKIGENKINYFEYFNFDAGDILIYTPVTPSYQGPPTSLDNDIYKVLSKTISVDGDTITYSFSKCHIDAINSGMYSTTQTHCKIVVTDLAVTGNFPYLEPLSFLTTNGYYAYTLDAHILDGPDIDGMMFGPAFAFEGYPTYVFQIGLGLQQYFFNGPPNYDYVSYKNVGYIKQLNTDDDCAFVETVLDTKSLHPSSSNLVIAPNPFDQSIALNATDLSTGTWNIRIVSALGVEVYNSEIIISSSNQQIDLSSLPSLTSGIYFLSFENASQVYSQKIVKK